MKMASSEGFDFVYLFVARLGFLVVWIGCDQVCGYVMIKVEGTEDLWTF